MTLGNLKATTLAALAMFAISATPATAALTYTTDDLFLAFRQAGNNSTDYVINIGQAALYRDASSTFSLNLSGLSADLTSAFGAGWASDSNITWGVVGTTQNTAATAPGNLTRLIYSSEPAGTVPTALSSQSIPANNIIAMKGYWQGLTTFEAVANSAFEDASNANSWNTKVPTAFGSSNLSPIEAGLSTNLDLFRIPQTTSGQPVSNEGFFNFNTGTGAVTFNVTPVPEPSTMLFGCAMLGALALNRRRTAHA